MGPLEWMRSLFGAQIDLRSGKEALTVSAFSLVEGTVLALSKAGITNAISFLVDKKVVYLDTNDVPDDIALIGQAAQESGLLDRPFKQMHLVLTHQETGLHTLLDIQIMNEVILGEAEMQVELSARVEEMRVRPGESAQAYAERVRAFGNPTALDPYRIALDELTERVANALRTSLAGARVKSEAAVIQLIRPEADQIARFRGLGFGNDVSAPAYRPVPTLQRNGAYADPYYYYYYDPYYDFMSWVLISNMMSPSYGYGYGYGYGGPSIYVVDPGGNALFTGATASQHSGDGWVGGGAVSFDGSGSVAVADTIPVETGAGDALQEQATLEASGSGESGSGDVGGDGGSEVGGSDDGGSGSSCSSASSCSSGSSCGSSCSSGSSCGSSCSN